jgi:hypothetical protein
MWAALLGGLIGAGIPGVLTYMGLRRTRQASDAEAFGPALLLLHRLNPYSVMANVNADPEVEAAKWADMPQTVETARGRLLVVSAGNPRKRVRDLAFTAQRKLGELDHAAGFLVHDMLRNNDNPGWVEHFREVHAETETAVRELIDANFAWGLQPWKRGKAVRSRPSETKPPTAAARAPRHRSAT